MNTIIDAADSCKGTITGSGIVRVDGSFEGTIKTKELVIVGPSGQLKADIEANEVIIGGKLFGNVKSRTKTKIETGAHVEGNIETGVLRIEDGAVFLGQCKMNG